MSLQDTRALQIMMSLVKVLAALLVLGVLGATVTLVERLKKETAVPQFFLLQYVWRLKNTLYKTSNHKIMKLCLRHKFCSNLTPKAVCCE